MTIPRGASLRIIAGRLKGRRLEGPSWGGLRPTSDPLRETLFNVLGPQHGARVLDGYAGTGALGLEALSRGAAHVTFVERDPRAVALIEQNLASCGVEDAYAIIRGDFLDPRRLAGRAFDLVLLDPPYEGVALDAVLDAASACVADGGRVVLEHGRRAAPPEAVGRLRRTRVITAGDSALSFYAPGVAG
jgi:16S rRNA (guanine(966)-N(2))-methyltransferase RsmD